MKKTTIVLFSVLVLAVSAVFAAKMNFQAADIINPVTGEHKNTVAIPAKAIEVAPNIFYLGTAVDKGRAVQGYAFVDYKNGFGRPGTICGNGICDIGENANKCPADCSGGKPSSSCYGFLAKGAKWKTLENYLVAVTNSTGLEPIFVRDNVMMDISKWEEAAGADILGNEIAGVVDGADTISPDNKNELLFGDIEEPGAIAITIVWGIFGGAPKSRELVEWDQVYDEIDYEWSMSGEAGKMDFENIATHELGHSVGMADLYTSECSEQTMYGYASYGETNKRSLEAGDITGIKQLY